MEWLAKLIRKVSGNGVYLAVGIGYLIGRLKFGGVGLGVVTGSLLGGILIGNFFHVSVSDQAKSILFLSVSLRNRLLGRTQFFSKSQRGWMALGPVGRICSRSLVY